MLKTIVVTVAGKDRTGVVEALAERIANAGGNWLESRMCRLGGEFAGILRAGVPAEKMAGLIENLEQLRSEGFSVNIQKEDDVPAAALTRTASLTLVGQDRPGIIYNVSSALAHHGINVEELETECSSAPMSGETMFRALARLHIPDTCDLMELRKELEGIGSELMVDITFSGL